ncbi:MAG: ZIP family metal transporter [Chloroflexi bacterium]|nr:ZIP family metal transporter [Chloroflexota bacterium]
MFEINTTIVFIAALITALATGLGAVPFFFFKEIPRKWLGVSNAIAAGLMLGASQGLIIEGFAYNSLTLIFGLIIGVIFIASTHDYLHKREDLSVSAWPSADARKAFIIIGVMTLHSISEGVGVGVAFGGREGLGELIATAIAVHNIPEGLAICLVMVPRGSSVWRAGLWSVFSSLPQPLMAVPAFLFVASFKGILPVGLGFAAGAMIWMVFAELIPDANEDASSNIVGTVIVFSLTAMLLFQELLSRL